MMLDIREQELRRGIVPLFLISTHKVGLANATPCYVRTLSPEMYEEFSGSLDDVHLWQLIIKIQFYFANYTTGVCYQVPVTPGSVKLTIILPVRGMCTYLYAS